MTRPQCGAKTRKGTVCTRPAMTNGRCYYHGGKSLSGIASPAWKTGRYSKALPARLLDRYHEGLADCDLLALTDEIAVVNARLDELIGRLDSGSTTQRWAELAAELAAFEAAKGADDTPAMMRHLEAMRLIASEATADAVQWEEIGDWMERARKLRETEWRRLAAMQQLITAEQAMSLVASLAAAVKTHVHDPDALRAISIAFRRLTNVSGEPN